MSCSSNRKMAVGSCISTLVSSTNRRRWLWATGFGAAPALAAAGPGSERLRRFKHFLRVPVHFHLAPLAPQDALGVDEERAAFDTHELAPVETLLADDVEQAAELAVFVRQELEGQPFLRLEFLVRGETVARDADHPYTG